MRKKPYQTSRDGRIESLVGTRKAKRFAIIIRTNDEYVKITLITFYGNADDSRQQKRSDKVRLTSFCVLRYGNRQI